MNLFDPLKTFLRNPPSPLIAVLRPEWEALLHKDWSNLLGY